MPDRIYLGTSFKKPFQPNSNAQVAKVRDIESINQSLKDIFETPKGSRFFNEAYGSEFHLVREEPNDSILESLLYEMAFDCIQEWEKRIDVRSIVFEQDDDNDISTKQMVVNYQVRNSNEIDSFIYPYYKELKT